MLSATVVWAVLLVLYVMKAFVAWEAVLDEIEHPIQCCFIGLVGVAPC
jgi:tellurite resistance protein